MSSGNAVFQPDVSAAAHWRLFRLLPTGIEVLGDASFEEWGAALSDLTRVQGNIQWWIGDMLAYGEARYGEKYVQAVEATGYAAQSLMNMVSVAARIPAEVRKPALSWSTHRAVAGLDVDVQRVLLDKADEQGWSSREMEEAVRVYKRELSAPKQSPSLPARVDGDPAPLPTAGPALTLEPEAEPTATPDVLDELKHADKRIHELETLVESLQSDDLHREIRALHSRLAQLEARLHAEITTANEAKRQAKYANGVLEKVRKALGVQKNSEILPAIEARKAA